jgi:hypothetical protein
VLVQRDNVRLDVFPLYGVYPRTDVLVNRSEPADTPIAKARGFTRPSINPAAVYLELICQRINQRRQKANTINARLIRFAGSASIGPAF